MRSADGRGPLWWAYETCNTAMVNLLKQYGQDPESTDTDAQGVHRPPSLRKASHMACDLRACWQTPRMAEWKTNYLIGRSFGGGCFIFCARFQNLEDICHVRKGARARLMLGPFAFFFFVFFLYIFCISRVSCIFSLVPYAGILYSHPHPLLSAVYI